jgi:hypothetical protein
VESLMPRSSRPDLSHRVYGESPMVLSLYTIASIYFFSLDPNACQADQPPGGRALSSL